MGCLLCLVATVLWLVTTFNRFVLHRNRVAEAWSGIDVQLKRRSDLIPNLVIVVKAYAEHETDLLTALTGARAGIDTGSVNARDSTERPLQGALVQLMAVVENYPDIKADENFRQLQSEFSDIEEIISRARRYYNGTVRDLNTALQMFPANVLAGLLGYGADGFFQLDLDDDRSAPRVSL